MYVNIDFITPEGIPLNRQLKVSYLATVRKFIEEALHEYLRSSAKDGYQSFGQPFVNRVLTCFAWNCNELNVAYQNEPDTPILSFLKGDHPTLLLQVKEPITRTPRRVLPRGNLEHFDFYQDENGRKSAVDKDGNEHVVYELSVYSLKRFKESANDMVMCFIDEPEFRGVVWKESPDEQAERHRELIEEASEQEQFKAHHHICQGVNSVAIRDHTLSEMARDVQGVHVMKVGFHQCNARGCCPHDRLWLNGSRLINHQMVIVPIQNYRTTLGMVVIDVLKKQLNVFRIEGTQRTFIDAYDWPNIDANQEDIFTLMLQYIAGEMALVNQPFVAESWQQNEYIIPRWRGSTHHFALCRAARFCMVKNAQRPILIEDDIVE